MHIITWTRPSGNGTATYEYPASDYRTVVEVIRRLTQQGIPFTHIFEE